MTTTLAPGSQVLDALDFKHVPPCEDRWHGCTKSAELVLYIACGKCVVLLCQSCRDWEHNFIRAHFEQRHVCRQCRDDFGIVTSVSQVIAREVPL